MTPTSPRYRQSADVVCRRVGEESILVPVRQNVGDLDSIFTLSPVAARVWELLDGTRDARAIAEVLSGEYDVDPETAYHDVTQLLEALGSIALIVETT